MRTSREPFHRDDLSVRLGAVDGWRSLDPTIPDLRTIYSRTLSRLNQRAQIRSAPVLVPRPGPGPTSPDLADPLRRYDESTKRLEELERQRSDALRKLDEEARELEEP